MSEPLLLEEQLANLMNDAISPQILPDIAVVSWRNTYLLVVQIFPSSIKPHYLKQQGVEKGTYIRVGSTNRLVDSSMLAELQRVRFEDSFDKQPIADSNSEVIDFRVASELFETVRKLHGPDMESMELLMTCQHKKVSKRRRDDFIWKKQVEIFS